MIDLSPYEIDILKYLKISKPGHGYYLKEISNKFGSESAEVLKNLKSKNLVMCYPSDKDFDQFQKGDRSNLNPKCNSVLDDIMNTFINPTGKWVIKDEGKLFLRNRKSTNILKVKQGIWGFVTGIVSGVIIGIILGLIIK